MKIIMKAFSILFLLLTLVLSSCSYINGKVKNTSESTLSDKESSESADDVETETTDELADEGNANQFASSESARANNYTESIYNKNIDTQLYLSYIYGISQNKYKWVDINKKNYYSFVSIDDNFAPKVNKKNSSLYEGLYTAGHITNDDCQRMIVYARKEYFDDDGGGNVTGINIENNVNGYTAKTAPIIFSINTKDYEEAYPSKCEESLINEGYVYVSCGVRGYNSLNEDQSLYTGKIGNIIADLKSAIIALRANYDVIPGDMDRIIAIGEKAGGNLAAILGATGDMPQYYEYLYENGTLGITLNDDGTYNSAFHDNVYATYIVSPTTDLENIDMENAWTWTGYENDKLSKYDRKMQELLSHSYVDYINSLMLKDKDKKELSLVGERGGAYYYDILSLLSESLNDAVENNNFDVKNTYGSDAENFIYLDKDTNKYELVDIEAFVRNEKVRKYNTLPVLHFDSKQMSSVNKIFGNDYEQGQHFSTSVASAIENNIDSLSKLDGYEEDKAYEYIDEVINGSYVDLIFEQAEKSNPAHVLLGINEYKLINPMKYMKSKTALFTENLMFLGAYNLHLAARGSGVDSEFNLLWGEKVDLIDAEFIDWINSKCKSVE